MPAGPEGQDGHKFTIKFTIEMSDRLRHKMVLVCSTDGSSLSMGDVPKFACVLPKSFLRVSLKIIFVNLNSFLIGFTFSSFSLSNSLNAEPQSVRSRAVCLGKVVWRQMKAISRANESLCMRSLLSEKAIFAGRQQETCKKTNLILIRPTQI